jgi:hypothetical protein
MNKRKFRHPKETFHRHLTQHHRQEMFHRHLTRQHPREMLYQQETRHQLVMRFLNLLMLKMTLM